MCKVAGVLPNEVLFFDDSEANLIDGRKAGVICVKVTNGMNKKVLEHGLQIFENSVPARYRAAYQVPPQQKQQKAEELQTALPSKNLE